MMPMMNKNIKNPRLVLKTFTTFYFIVKKFFNWKFLHKYSHFFTDNCKLNVKLLRFKLNDVRYAKKAEDWYDMISCFSFTFNKEVLFLDVE